MSHYDIRVILELTAGQVNFSDENARFAKFGTGSFIFLEKANTFSLQRASNIKTMVRFNA